MFSTHSQRFVLRRSTKQFKFLNIFNKQLRSLTTNTKFKPKKEEGNEVSLENARPYSEIPIITKFEFIRGILPNGVFYKRSLMDAMDLLAEKHGNIFILPGLFGKVPMLIALNPADFPVIFRNEGKWPNRKAFDFMVYHREVYRRNFFQGVEGLTTTNDEKWGQLRTAVNPILMQPKNMALYVHILLEVQEDFLQRIRQVRDPKTLEMPADFEDDLNRMTLESVTAVALNTHLGLLNKNRDTPESKTILYCIRKFFELSYYLEILPSVWRYIKTPRFKEMMNILDTLTDICNKHINEAITKLEYDANGKLISVPGEEKSVLEKLLRIDKKVAVVMALDMMSAGVDTTSSTLFGILLCLAKNPEKQQRLCEEIKTILPEKSSQPTIESMHNLPYLRACIKEGMRIYPIIPGTVRRIPQDVVLSGFRVPAGTHIAIGANLQMKKETFVPQAKEFIPERWLRKKDGSSELAGQIENSFMYIPFGFGPRSCVGKRIVNLEMELATALLVRNFKIEYNYPIENAFTAKFINVPNIPLKFKFEERAN